MNLKSQVSKRKSWGKARGTYSLLESGAANGLLLLALHGIIEQDTSLKNMELAVGEHLDVGQEGASGVLERVGKAETQDEARGDGESTHEGEKPEPTSLTTNATHVKDTVGEELGRGLSKLVAEVEEHDTLGGLLSGVPSRESPETTGNEPRLGHAQEESSSDEGTIAVLEGLEGTDGAEEEQLEGEPLARADAVEDHVGGNFEEDNTEGQHLLTDVELVLSDADILHEVVGDGIGNVTSIKLCWV